MAKMPLGAPLRSVFLLAMALWAVSAATAAADPRWGGLAPGPYAVGFRSEWRFDVSRTYRSATSLNATYGEAKSPRPILVNVWYPSRPGTGVAMTHASYFDIAAASPVQVVGLASALSAYARDIAAAYTLDAPLAELTDEDRRAAVALFSHPIAPRRNADAAGGRFPLIIYHPGYGSSFEDNAVLCEFLASQGFVVVSSAFIRRDGESFNIDAAEGSLADIGFLISTASGWPNVDWSRIGLVGHSGGAHTALRYQASGQSAVDAIVSLDTTQDSHNVSNPAWSHVAIVLGNLEYMTTPALIAAPPTAFYQLAERMDQADRFLVTVPELEHNDFISQGTLATEAATPAKPGAPRVRDQYDRLVRTVLTFLNAELRGDQTAMTRLTDSTPDDGLVADVEFLPKGVKRVRPYDPASSTAPTPAQLRHLVEDHGMAAGLAALERFKADGGLSIYAPTFAAVWLMDLSTANDPGATTLFEFYQRLDARLAARIKSTLSVWARLHGDRPAVAVLWQRALVRFYPDDAAAKTRLDAMEAAMAPSSID